MLRSLNMLRFHSAPSFQIWIIFMAPSIFMVTALGLCVKQALTPFQLKYFATKFLHPKPQSNLQIARVSDVL